MLADTSLLDTENGYFDADEREASSLGIPLDDIESEQLARDGKAQEDEQARQTQSASKRKQKKKSKAKSKATEDAI